MVRRPNTRQAEYSSSSDSDDPLDSIPERASRVTFSPTADPLDVIGISSSPSPPPSFSTPAPTSGRQTRGMSSGSRRGFRGSASREPDRYGSERREHDGRHSSSHRHAGSSKRPRYNHHTLEDGEVKEEAERGEWRDGSPVAFKRPVISSGASLLSRIGGRVNDDDDRYKPSISPPQRQSYYKDDFDRMPRSASGSRSYRPLSESEEEEKVEVKPKKEVREVKHEPEPEEEEEELEERVESEAERESHVRRNGDGPSPTALRVVSYSSSPDPPRAGTSMAPEGGEDDRPDTPPLIEPPRHLAPLSYLDSGPTTPSIAPDTRPPTPPLAEPLTIISSRPDTPPLPPGLIALKTEAEAEPEEADEEDDDMQGGGQEVADARDDEIKGDGADGQAVAPAIAVSDVSEDLDVPAPAEAAVLRDVEVEKVDEETQGHGNGTEVVALTGAFADGSEVAEAVSAAVSEDVKPPGSAELPEKEAHNASGTRPSPPPTSVAESPPAAPAPSVPEALDGKAINGADDTQPEGDVSMADSAPEEVEVLDTAQAVEVVEEPAEASTGAAGEEAASAESVAPEARDEETEGMEVSAEPLAGMADGVHEATSQATEDVAATAADKGREDVGVEADDIPAVAPASIEETAERKMVAVSAEEGTTEIPVSAEMEGVEEAAMPVVVDKEAENGGPGSAVSPDVVEEVQEEKAPAGNADEAAGPTSVRTEEKAESEAKVEPSTVVGAALAPNDAEVVGGTSTEPQSNLAGSLPQTHTGATPREAEAVSPSHPVASAGTELAVPPSHPVIEPSSSLSTIPDPSSPSSRSAPVPSETVADAPTLPVEAEQAAPIASGADNEMAVQASSPAQPQFEEEGEEELDPEDKEDADEDDAPEHPEPADDVEADSQSKRGDSSDMTDLNTPGPTSTEPAEPVVYNKDGTIRQRPGRKTAPKPAGWKSWHKNNYTYENGVAIKKVKDTKESGAGKKGKVEALKSAARGRSGSSPISDVSDTPLAVTKADHKAETMVVEDEPEDEDAGDEDEVYCPCGKESRKDGNDTLVGCDGCDIWFHAGCVNLSEEEIGLMDKFFCADCEKSTGRKTTIKLVCKREGCEREFAPKQSRFCSPNCGYRHAQAIVEAIPIKKQRQQLAASLAYYPSPEPDVRITEFASTSPVHPHLVLSPLPDPIDTLTQQIDSAQAHIAVLEKRVMILGKATEQCESLAPLNPVNGDEAGKKKRKPAGEDRPCGWVEGLIWDDEVVGAWEVGMPLGPVGEGGEGEDVVMAEQRVGLGLGGYCSNPRKRCDRHNGWQKTMSTLLDMELNQLRETLATLMAEKDHLIHYAEAKQGGKIARENLHEIFAVNLAKKVG